jgi:hypothetical protein
MVDFLSRQRAEQEAVRQRQEDANNAKEQKAREASELAAALPGWFKALCERLDAAANAYNQQNSGPLFTVQRPSGEETWIARRGPATVVLNLELPKIRYHYTPGGDPKVLGLSMQNGVVIAHIDNVRMNSTEEISNLDQIAFSLLRPLLPPR